MMSSIKFLRPTSRATYRYAVGCLNDKHADGQRARALMARCTVVRLARNGPPRSGRAQRQRLLLLAVGVAWCELLGVLSTSIMLAIAGRVCRMALISRTAWHSQVAW